MDGRWLPIVASLYRNRQLQNKRPRCLVDSPDAPVGAAEAEGADAGADAVPGRERVWRQNKM